ncbi:uncharacterized protein At4g22758 [Sorghum bicolor]|uniref:DUF7054 domain-containing protein n=1 Tax=Sorghum bicolor TaxID=4558 RepID=C5YFR7_SORBI|nr:uncharacterized protein At4g22758 [Sorghum bicolor]EES12096.1 hypothetical protein SORBI_3006G065900 [Sorghum bicolor]|eukprot:XP_002447768.1 uncharacterized protein At4g22758 [Sorghum bicolor]
MPPLQAPPHGEKSSSSGGGGGRHQRQGMAGAASQQRSASFHGRGTEQQRHLQPHQKQRPKTLPDVLAGVRGAGFRSGSSPPGPADGDTGRTTRTPSKVLVSVAVQQSMWPLHVMASAEWTVADLVAAAVALYVKEGRRPLLPSTDPAAFGLHYSQFCLESLDPKEKIMELGSRSFFLCPRSSAAGQDASSSSPGTANGVIRAASGKTPAWLSNMPFWPTM